MQQYQLELIAADRPELPERVLRIVRHRGFQLNALQLTQNNGQLKLQLTVSCEERPLHTLTRQLEKLIDVQSLSLLESAPIALQA